MQVAIVPEDETPGLVHTGGDVHDRGGPEAVKEELLGPRPGDLHRRTHGPGKTHGFEGLVVLGLATEPTADEGRDDADVLLRAPEDLRRLAPERERVLRGRPDGGTPAFHVGEGGMRLHGRVRHVIGPIGALPQGRGRRASGIQASSFTDDAGVGSVPLEVVEDRGGARSVRGLIPRGAHRRESLLGDVRVLVEHGHHISFAYDANALYGGGSGGVRISQLRAVGRWSENPRAQHAFESDVRGVLRGTRDLGSTVLALRRHSADGVAGRLVSGHLTPHDTLDPLTTGQLCVGHGHSRVVHVVHDTVTGTEPG